MRNNKLVSVVIPSYNHEKYIEQAIESVFKQNYRPIELIVVDDNSRDRSPEIIATLKERYRKADKNFKFTFIRKEKNSDAPTTINLGLSKARGEFVAILNSDDYYAEDRIKTLVEAAKAKNKELLFTDVEIVDSSGVKLPGQHPRAHWLHQALSFRHELPSIGYMMLRRPHVVTTGNLFFKRALLKKLKGFRQHRWHHDWDFVLRATRFTEPFFISKRLLSYRIHDSNTISEMENSSKEIGRLGDARSDCEIRRIIENFYEETMMTPLSQSTTNPLAPIPEFWPDFFLSFLKHQNTWYSGVSYLKEISLCNRSLLKNQDVPSQFFQNARMTKEDVIQSLRVFPDIAYMHVGNFPRKALKNFPKIRFEKSTPLKLKRMGEMGAVVTLTARFKTQAPLLAESFIAVFRGNRLASVARAVSKKENTLTYLGYLVEPLTKGEHKKLTFCVIEPHRHLDYTLYFPTLPKKKPKKKTWSPAIRSHFGRIDYLNASGSVLHMGGWSAHQGELPMSLTAYFNGKQVPTLPSLYFRPDLSGLLEHPNKTSIGGFRFWFDLGYLRVFESGEGVLEIRSEFENQRGVLDRFHISSRKGGLIIEQEGILPAAKKVHRKKRS